MIMELTDYKTKEKFRIATTGNKYLPCFGEDGVMYYWLSNLYLWGGTPRNDCRVLDLEKGIGLKEERNGDDGSVIRWDSENSRFTSFEDVEIAIDKLNIK